MGCDIKFKELSLYVDGRYAGAKKAHIEEHLLSCPHCKEQLEMIKALKSSLENLTPIKESAGFDFEFNRLLQEKLNRRKARLLSSRLKEIFEGMRDTILYPTPALVRVAVSFVVIVAILGGMRSQMLEMAPRVEFVAGDVKVYKAGNGRAVLPKINMRLNLGDKIEAEEGAIFNIACKGKYKARIKDKSLIVLSQLRRGWNDVDAKFSMSNGNLLVNTAEKFKGSKMNVYTPACDAEVVGTAFMVKVLPERENETWLGVLKGTVKVSSKVHPLKAGEMKEAVAYISSGQKTRIKPYEYQSVPELFSEKEWQMMQELYQLAEVPQIILLIGTEADRLEELLRPAPIYIPDIKPKTVPGNIQHMVDSITKATNEARRDLIPKKVTGLERLLERHPNPKYDVEILMFIASHYHYTRDYANAIRVFERVIKEYPQSQFASLAQCAVGAIYQNNLKDPKRAETAYRSVLESYPNSVDAVRAHESLSR